MSSNQSRFRGAIPALAVFCLFGQATLASAGTITVSGLITQSIADGTGPASNNTSLNNIADNQNWTLSYTFPGAISGPGSYSPGGSTLQFSVGAAPASESAFGSVSLTITASGATDQFSLLGCLTTGSGCAFGNQLSASFSIPAAQVNGSNVVTTGLDQPHPLDLLEDDGITDIQGSITRYTYSGPASPAPEPASVLLAVCGLAALAISRKQQPGSFRQQIKSRGESQ